MIRLMLIGSLLAGLLLAGFPGGAVQPAAAQGGNVWTAQFYNNSILGGDPVYTTTYQSASLDWGTGSPAPNVQADNFTARLATDAYFTAGTYRFYLLADDAIQLWIDFPPTLQPSVSTFNAPVPGQLVTVDVTLTTGFHHVQVDFKENSGLAYLRVDWKNLATNPTGPGFSTPITTPIGWTALYFPNANLSGFASVTQNESNPSHDWGTNAPAAGLPADNFSARWSGFPTLNNGTYEISVQADDGVRVFVDGALLINEFHTASGQTYTATFSVPQTSQRTIVIEYYEATGFAFLAFNLRQTSGSDVVQPPPPPSLPSSPTGAYATVTTYRLNVRSAPSLGGDILTKIDRGQTYPVLARNQEATWWQISVGNITGWVSAPFVSVTNAQIIPVAGAANPTPVPVPSLPGGPTATVLSARLNVRSGPALVNNILTVIGFGETYPLVGRNANGTWWQVNVNGLVGWISGALISINNEQQVPITG